MSISVNNLTKIYGTQKAVNNISFQVGKGEIVGFLGPNGAGKSTTMKIITGYLEASGGKATVCGEDVGSNAISTKKKIGYLPESNALYYEMYVREYLEFVANVHQIKEAKEAIQKVIETVGLTPESNKKIGQLSKGYKQRVGLAAALIHNPEVLILDEPTSGLDPNQIVEIREVIKKLGQDKTVLFSSHILQEVEAICDRVIIINKGTIVADDKLSNLQKGTSGTQFVIVQFKENIGEIILKELNGVIDKQKLETGAWRLNTDNPENLRKQLLELSLKNNLNIVSLQDESSNLEGIFRNLTLDKDGTSFSEQSKKADVDMSQTQMSWFLLGFFFSFVGIILALLTNDEKRNERIKWSAIGTGIAFVTGLFYFLIKINH